MHETGNDGQPPMIAERVTDARRSWMLWLPAAAWAMVIFGFSSLHGSQVPGGYAVEGHLGEYFVFGALLALPLLARRPGAGSRRALLTAVLLATLIASAYGVTDEFHQSFVPGRTPDPVDWADDTAGALAGATTAAAIAWFVGRRRERRAVETAEADAKGRGPAPKRS